MISITPAAGFLAPFVRLIATSSSSAASSATADGQFLAGFGLPPLLLLLEMVLLLFHGDEIHLGEAGGELGVVERFLGRIGEDGPGVGDEAEGGVGEGELVLVGVEEEGEAAVLLLDEVGVVGALRDLEDRVPVGLIVGEAFVVGGD